MLVEELARQLEAAMLERKQGLEKSSLAIQGTEVTATSPEGKTATMPLDAFLAKVAARRMDTGGVVLPDGVKAIITEGAITVCVCEYQPSVQRLMWIAQDSPVPFGPGTKYRDVSLALPYLVVLAVFSADAHGQLVLTTANECFFRVAPLKSLEDPLLYPGLLNCSRFEPQEGHPLSWICTQHLKPNLAMRDPDLNKRLAACFRALHHCLFETGFNLSSEHHEASSWFTESRKVDPRVRTVEAWEAATTNDQVFVLDVPWLPTGHSVRAVAERIFKNLHTRTRSPRTAAALARIVFNHQSPPNPSPSLL
ncbi:MAG: hypothetical protein AB9869_30920 [Verrucomicrobiia bacterium]